MPKLKNSKREEFCQQFMVDRNATQSAIRAGYSEKTAGSQGQRLLKNVDIQHRISEIEQDARKRTENTVDSIIEELNDNRDQALRCHMPGAMNQATMAKAKILGLDKPVEEGELSSMNIDELISLYDKQHEVIMRLRNES